MKKLILTGAALFALALIPIPASAQTTNFFTQVFQWGTSFNTSLYYPDAMVWEGTLNNGVDTVSETGAAIDLWRGAGNSGTNYSGGFYFGAEERTRAGANLGTITSQSGGVTFGYCKYDFKAGVYLDGVYRLDKTVLADNRSAMAGEVGVRVSKLMTQYTGLTAFIALQSGNSRPLVGMNFNITLGGGKGLFGL